MSAEIGACDTAARYVSNFLALLQYIHSRVLKIYLFPKESASVQHVIRCLRVGVFTLGLIGGAHESIDSVRFLFDKLNFKELVDQCDAHGGSIVIPVDMKMQALLLGLQNQSSRYPMPYDLWSQRAHHSDPDVSPFSILLYSMGWGSRNRERSVDKHWDERSTGCGRTPLCIEKYFTKPYSAECTVLSTLFTRITPIVIVLVYTAVSY